MRESRLFRIVYYLLQNGKATAPELAQKLKYQSEPFTEILTP